MMTMTTMTRLFRQGTRRLKAATSSTPICTSVTPQYPPWSGSCLAGARLQSTHSNTTSGGGTVLHTEWIHNNNHRNHNKSQTNKDHNDNDIHKDHKDHHTLVFLHGLLGNGRNIHTLAKKMCAALDRPGLLVDLTGHGGSKGRPTMNQTVTFDTCLADIHATLLAAGIASTTDTDSTEQHHNHNHPHVTIVGHSLGGRLALQYAHEQYHSGLQHVWLLDTVPGQAHASVVNVLQICESILVQPSWSGVTRRDMTAVLTRQYGLDGATAAWLASSFTVHDVTGAAEFGFCAKVARDLVEDFGRQEFMYELQQTVFRSDSDHAQNVYNHSNNNNHSSHNNGQTVRVDLVRGAKNTAWEASGHLPALHHLMEQHGDQFGFHTVQAGHNVHVEDLPGLLQAVDRVAKRQR